MKKLAPEDLRREGGLRTVNSDAMDDLFLVCASYEPRTLFATEHLAKDYRARRAVVYVNREFLEGAAGWKTRPHIYRLIERLAHHADSVSVAEGSWLSPVDQLIALRTSLLGNGHRKEGTGPSVTLDCSTFNREALLTALLLLRTHYPKAHCRILYVSPAQHGKWLSSGFRLIRNVMGLSGIQHPSLPTLLAVLSGFEPERTEKLIEEHEPAKVLLGVGDPPTSAGFLDRNVVEQKLILARQDVERFQFAATDIKECFEHVSKVLEPCLSQHNIVLAPMSTKLSTVAALLVAEKWPDIQVTYCVPGEYNIDDYSAGAESLFIDQVPHAE